MRTWGPEVGQLSAAQGGLASASTRIRSLDLPSWLFAHGFDLLFCADGRVGLDPDLESGPWLESRNTMDFIGPRSSHQNGRGWGLPGASRSLANGFGLLNP